MCVVCVYFWFQVYVVRVHDVVVDVFVVVVNVLSLCVVSVVRVVACGGVFSVCVVFGLCVRVCACVCVCVRV